MGSVGSAGFHILSAAFVSAVRYESTSTRMFAEGRTETIRTTSIEVLTEYPELRVWKLGNKGTEHRQYWDGEL
jgi:hypothetical protein